MWRKIGEGYYRVGAINSKEAFIVEYDKKSYKLIVAPTNHNRTVFNLKSKEEIRNKIFELSDKQSFEKYSCFDIDELRYDIEEQKEKEIEETKKEVKIEKEIEETKKEVKIEKPKTKPKAQSKSSSSKSKMTDSKSITLAVLIIIGLYFLGEYEDSNKAVRNDAGFNYNKAIKEINFSEFKTLNDDEVKKIARTISFKHEDFSEIYYRVNHQEIEGLCRESKEASLLKECAYGVVTSEKFLLFFEKNRKMKIVKKHEGEKLLLTEKDYKENKKLKDIISKLVAIYPYFKFYDNKNKPYLFSTPFKLNKEKDIPRLALKEHLYDSEGDKIDISYLKRNQKKLEKLEKDVLKVKNLMNYIDKKNGLYNYTNAKNINEFKEGIKRSIRHTNYEISQFQVRMNSTLTKKSDKAWYIDKITKARNNIKKYKYTLKLIDNYKI